MEESHNNRTALAKGAKDIAKEAKKHAAKNFGKAVDRASDEYSTQRSYSRFQDEDEDENAGAARGGQDGRYAGNAADGDDDGDEASSDATEGHDDEDEIYEGEYQGVPSRGDGKTRDGQVALGQPVSDSQKSRKELQTERQSDEEELAQQYELIMQECGHGRFQWQLFFVLGLALMSDGVEVFVVGFVLPSAETDIVEHIVGNLLMQLLLGIPLELVHKGFEVGMVYLAGVLAGSLASSIFDPLSALVGASGGVYALIGGYLMNAVVNFREMIPLLGVFRILAIVIFVGTDFGFAFYRRFLSDEAGLKVSFVAHFGGIAAGMTIGYVFFSAYNKKLMKDPRFWLCIGGYALFVVFAVVFNIFLSPAS